MATPKKACLVSRLLVCEQVQCVVHNHGVIHAKQRLTIYMRLQHRFGRRLLACDLTLVLSGDENQHQPQLQLQGHLLQLHSFHLWDK